MNDSVPPLLRGVGMSLVLAAAVIAFYIARKHNPSQQPTATPHQLSSAEARADSVSTLVSEVRALRAEVEQEDVVDEVLDDTSFELMSFTGTALMAASFFAEAYLRRKRKAEPPLSP
jgi:hypothetical protein